MKISIESSVFPNSVFAAEKLRVLITNIVTNFKPICNRLIIHNYGDYRGCCCVFNPLKIMFLLNVVIMPCIYVVHIRWYKSICKVSIAETYKCFNLSLIYYLFDLRESNKGWNQNLECLVLN